MNMNMNDMNIAISALLLVCYARGVTLSGAQLVFVLVCHYWCVITGVSILVCLYWCVITGVSLLVCLYWCLYYAIMHTRFTHSHMQQPARTTHAR